MVHVGWTEFGKERKKEKETLQNQVAQEPSGSAAESAAESYRKRGSPNRRKRNGVLNWPVGVGHVRKLISPWRDPRQGREKQRSESCWHTALGKAHTSVDICGTVPRRARSAHGPRGEGGAHLVHDSVLSNRSARVRQLARERAQRRTVGRQRVTVA